MPPSFVWLGLAVTISVACFSIHAEVLTDFHFCKNDEKGDYHVNFSPLYASAGTTCWFSLKFNLSLVEIGLISIQIQIQILRF